MSEYNSQRMKKNQSRKRKSSNWSPYSNKHIRRHEQMMLNKSVSSFDTGVDDIVCGGNKTKRGKKGKRGKKCKKKCLKRK